jgi:uncharacterized membrane protein
MMDSMYETALFLHILGAFILFAGVAVDAIGVEVARRRRKPADIAALLRVARAGALLVAMGALSGLAFGLWLVDLSGRSLTEAWIALTLVLYLAAVVLGVLGGQRARGARLLATRLAYEREASGDLLRLLDDRVARSLNFLAGVAVVAILALMTWKPGG